MLKKENFSEVDECVVQYMSSLKKITPLKKEEEHILMQRYKKKNDINARNKLVVSNLKYAVKLANKYRGRGVPYSYLISEANSALLYAIEKFDESRDVKLLTYAKWWINQRMDSYIHKQNLLTTEDLPTDHEKQQSDDSVDYDYNNDLLCVDNDEFYISDDYEQKKDEGNAFLENLYTVLSDRESDIVNMKFGTGNYNKEYTLEEIGKKYNITKERTRKIIEKSLMKMRGEAMVYTAIFHKAE